MIEEIETILQKILQPVTVKVLNTSLRSRVILNRYKIIETGPFVEFSNRVVIKGICNYFC